MENNVVSVRGLSYAYGDFSAVDGIDLNLREGELLALLGTNGAGKTTTLEVLEGHRRADRGEVEVLGRDPFRYRRRLAGDVTVMLQEAGFAGDLTAAETLRMWQAMHPEHTGPADPLSEVDLDHRRDVRVKQLSGGERRRLDLALAISTGPRLLFLDEPTTGLDPAARERTWEVLRGLLARGRSILLTTHYLEEAEALADHIAIMHEGRIAVQGTTEEILASHPARIRCRLPHPMEPPSLLGATTLEGRELIVRTDHLQADLQSLLGWAHELRIDLEHLTATEATLAEIFLSVQNSIERIPA